MFLKFVYCLSILKHCAVASIRIWERLSHLFIKSNIQSWIYKFWICSPELVCLLSKLVHCLSILKHCALASIRMWDMANSHSSSLVSGWPLSVVVRLLDLYFWNWKLDAPLNYNYDGIAQTYLKSHYSNGTLPRNLNGSSSFCKGPRDPKSPCTLRLCMSEDLCKNYDSHLNFAVVTFLTKIQNWCYTTKKLVKTWLKKFGW